MLCCESASESSLWKRSTRRARAAVGMVRSTWSMLCTCRDSPKIRRAFTQAVSVKMDCCTEIGSVKATSSDAAARRLSTAIAVCTRGADECVSSLRVDACAGRSCTNFANGSHPVGRQSDTEDVADSKNCSMIWACILLFICFKMSVGVGLSGTDPAMEKSGCCKVRGLVPVIRACVRGVPDRSAVVGFHRSSSCQ